MLTRRAALALSLLTLADAPLPGDGLRLPEGMRFSCPPLRARWLATMAFRAGPVGAVGFGCDAPGVTQDLLALVAADGSLLALERLSWRGAGAMLATRFAMLPDRTHLALKRDATMPGRPMRHEAWTDYLRRDALTLTDAPARPVLAGTLQQALAVERQTLAIRPGLHEPPTTLLAALRASALNAPERTPRDRGEEP